MITALIYHLHYTEEGLCLLLEYHKSVTQLRLVQHDRKLRNEAEKDNGKREEAKIIKRKKTLSPCLTKAFQDLVYLDHMSDTAAPLSPYLSCLMFECIKLWQLVILKFCPLYQETNIPIMFIVLGGRLPILPRFIFFSFSLQT